MNTSLFAIVHNEEIPSAVISVAIIAASYPGQSERKGSWSSVLPT